MHRGQGGVVVLHILKVRETRERTSFVETLEKGETEDLGIVGSNPTLGIMLFILDTTLIKKSC